MQTTKRVRVAERERASRVIVGSNAQSTDATRSAWIKSERWRWLRRRLRLSFFFCCTLQLELLVKRSNNNNIKQRQRQRQRSIERWQDNWWAYWVKWNEREREGEIGKESVEGRLTMVFNECADKSDQSKSCCCCCCWRFEGNLPREVHLHSLSECVSVFQRHLWWVAVAAAAVIVVVVAPFAAYVHKATGEKAKQKKEQRERGERNANLGGEGRKKIAHKNVLKNSREVFFFAASVCCSCRS